MAKEASINAATSGHTGDRTWLFVIYLIFLAAHPALSAFSDFRIYARADGGQDPRLFATEAFETSAMLALF
jgi:hypothetical protein